MSLPGFTAEVAIGQTRVHYRTPSRRQQVTSPIGLASCDNNCLQSCLDNPPECWELRLSGAACQRALIAYRQGCHKMCCH